MAALGGPLVGERLEAWVQDDLLRPQLKKKFEEAWLRWEDREALGQRQEKSQGTHGTTG